MRGTAFLLGPGSPVREFARRALAAVGWQVLDGGATAADAARFDDLAGGAAPQLVVFVAAPLGEDDTLTTLSPARFRELEAAVLVEPWLALRAASLRQLAPGAAVLLVADVAGVPGARGAFAAAAQRALRTMVAAAAVEFGSRPAPLRVNLLEYAAPGLDPEAFGRALDFLSAPAASFMTGTHLALPGAIRPVPRDPAQGPVAASPRAGDGALAGRVIAITGATSGIGRASALACAREGATVLVTGRNATRGEAVVAEVRAAGGVAEYLRQDVTCEADWQRTVASIRDRHGRLDALVNNAGESINKPIAQLTHEDFWFLLRVNLEACYLGMRSSLPLLAESGGAVLNVSSVAALRGGPGGTIYGPSKAAMTGLSAAAAAEGGRFAPAVRVNALHPGFIWGEGPVESLGEEGARQFREKIVAKTPLRRVGEVADVAEVIVYLLSDPARGISGQEIVVDGGLALSYP